MWSFISIFILAIVISACFSTAANQENSQPQGRILVWHNFNEAQSQVLAQLFDEFTTLYPQVTIIQSAVPAGEMLTQFQTRAELGLGPDLLIGPSRSIRPLVEADLIQNLSNQAFDSTLYLSTAIETLQYQNKQYGWPLAIQTDALYYNKKQVEQPANTLQLLLAQADQGKGIAIGTQFEDAFWGVQAFGGQLFDDEGRVILDQGGFTNWLSWLKTARETPRVILDRDNNTLLSLFKQGQVAYYIGGPEVLPQLQADLGEETVGVAPLPAGPNGAAGPFLETTGLMLNTASTENQTELALRLARFLMNLQQQRNLMRDAGLVPAHLRVRVDGAIYPALAGFLAQSKTAVPRQNSAQMEALSAFGNEVYVRALENEDIAGLTQAVYDLAERANQLAGLAPSQANTQPPCNLEGNFELWHSWSEQQAQTLQRLVRLYTNRCPGVFIQVSQFEPDMLLDQFRNTASGGQGPTLLIAEHYGLATLAELGLIRNINTMVDQTLWQQFVPGTSNALRYQSGIYGLPASIQIMILYYNANLVEDPARILADLEAQAAPDQQVILPSGFETAFWGVAAFGGISLDTEGRLVLDVENFAAWLDWLRAAQKNLNITISDNLSSSQALFLERKAAYWVAPSNQLTQLQVALGRESVNVITLPAGPAGEAGPLLHIDALMLNTNAPESKAKLALDFALFLTSVEAQTLLMTQANQIPSNINVDLGQRPANIVFLAQANASIVFPNMPQTQAIFAAGDQVYQAVLANQGNPLQALKDFVTAANETELFVIKSSNLLTVTTEPTPNQTPTLTPTLRLFSDETADQQK